MTYSLNLNELIHQNLSQQWTVKQIENYFSQQQSWAWVGYVLLPLALYIKTLVIALILDIGGFFNDVALPFKKYWRLVLQSEFIFLFAGLVKLLWLKFIIVDFTYEQVQQTVPFSLQSLLDTSNIPHWAIYPLQWLNLFQVLYWIMLIALLNQATRSSKGFHIVMISYFPGAIIWILLIMFLSLNAT
ncbi:MAG: hypothetical protein OXE55_06665 [Flavobacteriaceae bacterium]|nr:hypothetical protein [Flavobacteriaceae bacterium]